MSQLDMAMAVNGNHVHSGMNSGPATTQAPENCWSTTGWEHQNLTDSTSIEGSGGGDYGSGRMPEWDLKANSWEWENLTMVYPRQGEGNQRLQQQSNDWASGACSAVTLATSAGASKTGEFSIGLGSGCSTPSGTSVSSGIPGVGAGRGNSGADGHSALVKSEPDEQAVERTAIGTPASLSAQKDRLFFSLGGVQSPQNEEWPPEKDGTARGTAGGQSNGSSVVTGGGDSLNIGLKLGRRTYFEDSSGGAQAKASSAPALSPPGKKPRVMSPNTQIARCQVEGCKADLSGCKDYHRRHKVCEMHSKAPKAIAAGIEQRFCQQCSRFHVLTEFDEGKRSCRRRLAGHNERRRKPHPETHSVFGLRNSSSLNADTSSLAMDSAPFYFLDSKRSNFLHRHRGSSLDAEFHPYTDVKRTNPWSMLRRDDTSLACQLQAASTERQSIFSTMSRPTADRLLMLLQNPKTQMAAPNSSTGINNLGGHRFLEGPVGPLGQSLSLSSSRVGVLGSLEQQHSRIGSCSQSLSSVSGLTNSGRALSLLSSQSWAPRPPPGASSTPVALDLSQASDSTLEQLVASSSDSSNRGSRFSHLQLPSQGGSPTSAQQQQFDNNNNNNNKQFSIQSQGCLDSVGLNNCGLTATGNGTPQNQACGNGNNNIMAGLGVYDETNSMLALVQAGQDLRALNSASTTSDQALQTIDLMQIPGQHASSHSNGLHPQVSSGQYSGYSSLRPFESSIFSSQ